VVDLGVDILEPLELELVGLHIEDIEGLLRLDEFFCLHLRIRVPNFYSVFGALLLSQFFDVHVPGLKVGAGLFSEVIADDPIDRGLGAVSSAVGEGFVGKRNSSGGVLQGTHSEGNSSVIMLSEFIIILGCNLTPDDCLLIKFHKISGIMRVILELRLVEHPRLADVLCALLVGLVRLAVGEAQIGEISGGGLGLAHIILHDQVVGPVAQNDVFSLSYHIGLFESYSL